MADAQLNTLRINELDLAYRIDGDGAPTRPWLVFAHGLGHDHSMWDAQVEAFGRACNVLRYDLRGHGRSSAPAGDYTIEQLADDLRGLLDALQIKRCHLIGLSLGGMVAQQAAIRSPLRFASLTLAATACRFSSQMRPIWDSRIAAVRTPLGMNAIVEATLSQWFTAAFFATRANDVARAARALRRTPVAGYIGCMTAMARADLAQRLSAIDCRTQVLVGEDDRLMPPAYSEQIARQIREARLYRVAHAAHLVNIEQADEFNDFLRRFLAGGP